MAVYRSQHMLSRPAEQVRKSKQKWEGREVE